MYLQKIGSQSPDSKEPEIYTFKQEDGRWYIHLLRYLEQGWSKKDLQMVEGAHKFLNWISNGAKKVRLRWSTVPREGADILKLVEHCNAPRGGAIYRFVPGNGKPTNETFWICDLALFVFGDLPEQIYVQRLPAKANKRLKKKSGTS